MQRLRFRIQKNTLSKKSKKYNTLKESENDLSEEIFFDFKNSRRKKIELKKMKLKK